MSAGCGPPDLTGPVEAVAPRLLGAVMRHGEVAVRITEVEAYGGADDAGSHASRGRTRRNATMFGPTGRLYCYLSYGMHVCLNVAVGSPERPAAVLIRAGEVVAGLDDARSRRPGAADRDLARGPGRLGRVLAVGLDHDGVDLAAGPVTLRAAGRVSGPATGPATGPVNGPVNGPANGPAFEAGPRVGLRLEAARPWRFWLPGEPTVSPYRRHPQADLASAPDVP